MTINEFNHDANPDDQHQQQAQQPPQPSSSQSNHDYPSNTNMNIHATFASFPPPSAPIMSPRTANATFAGNGNGTDNGTFTNTGTVAGTDLRLDSNPPIEDYYEQEEKDAELARRLQVRTNDRPS